MEYNWRDYRKKVEYTLTDYKSSGLHLERLEKQWSTLGKIIEKQWCTFGEIIKSVEYTCGDYRKTVDYTSRGYKNSAVY